MLAKQILSEAIPALHLNDTAQKALIWMDIFRVSHLPVVEEGKLLGLVSDGMIFDANLSEETLDSTALRLLGHSLQEDQHIFEVLDLFAQEKITLAPVLNREKRYVGNISINDLVHQFSKIAGARSPGGIIELEMHHNDYALSQIARIVEEQSGKILSLYSALLPGSLRLSITLKISLQDLSGIIRALERHGYEIKATYTENAKIDELLNNRYEEFMNFLNT